MPTVIDSISIEIESNSTSAAVGIGDLAASLEKLKKNGSVGVAIKNLKELSSALKSMTSTASNANKISSLASAMEKLKSVGSAGAGVKKLSESLQSLNSVDYTSLKKVSESTALFERLAASLNILSSVKPGGIASIVTGLSKIGEVTNSLDDDTIEQFGQRVELVTHKLSPLSEKMKNIQAGFQAINSTAKKADGGIKKFGKGLNVASINLSSFIHIMQSAVQFMQKTVDKFQEFIADAVEWDGISARFGRGFGSAASETYEWIQRLNDEMSINVQQFMQYSSTYATMLKGFGVAQEDAAKMALGYMELTYDIWAGYNDIYKSLDDAAAAVRSAIAGEVEPVRKAGFTIVEATLKQTAANHGLKVSLESATEAQKSYLRYLTLVDQAHDQNLVGTYAREMNTAEGVMRTFSQQIKSISQAFGSLFLPALTAVMPYLQAFVELLTAAVQRIAALFGVTIQGVDWSGYNSGVGDAAAGTSDLADAMNSAGGAAKNLKNATMGIDELNIIGDTSGGGGGGGGLGSAFTGLDVASLWDESIFDKIQSRVGEIKEKIEDVLPVVASIAAGLAAWAISDKLLKSTKKIKSFFEDIALDFMCIDKVRKSLGIGLMVTGFTLEFSGAYDLGYEGATLENILKTAIGSALGIGGSLLFFGSTPVGWAVGISVALTVLLTGAVFGASKAMEDIRKQLVFDNVFDGAGVEIGYLADAYIAVIEQVQNLYTPMTETVGVIQRNREETGKLTSEFNHLVSGIGSGVLSVEETLPRMVDAFNALYDNTVTTLNAQRELILYSLSGATGEAVVAMGGDLLTAANYVNQTTNDMISDWDGYNAEFNRIQSELSAGTITAADALEQLNAATERYSSILAVTNPDLGEFKSVLDNATKNINYGDFDSVNTAFSEIGNAALLAKDDVNAFYDELNVALEDMRSYLEEAGQDTTPILELLVASDTARANALSEINNQVQGLIDDVCANMISEAETQFNDAAAEFENLNWFQKLLYGSRGGAAAFAEDALYDYRREFVTPFADGVKTALGEELAADMDVWAEDAMNSLMGGLIAYDPAKGGAVETLAGQLSETIESVLPNRMKESGVAAVDGLTSGIAEKTADATDAFKGLGENSITAFDEALDINSPSKEMWDRGMWTVLGLADGIKENKHEVLDVLTQLGDEMLSKFNSIANSCRATISSMVSSIAAELSSLSISASTTISSAKMSTKKYAAGGFPNTGEMFIARENGPELVGTIGGRTAVANNAQIEAGIEEAAYRGFMRAMNNQSQNGKPIVVENKLYLDRKQLRLQMQQADREAGAGIMKGGVMA